MEPLEPKPAPSRPLRVAVCVASYRRPEGLQRLLGALDRQEFRGDAPDLHFFVVDNDAEGSARRVCRSAASWLSHPLSYTIEKKRGTPHARNTAVAAALGAADWLAFVDDDELPEPSWLDELLEVQRKHDADVVTGPVVSRFLEEPARWIVEGGFFDAPRHRTGDLLDQAFTNNVLVRASTLGAMDRLFDERLLLGVGEDSDLFARIARAGYRIVWADAAVVLEFVPPSRTRLAWLLRRGFCVGAAAAFVDRQELSPRDTITRLALHGSYCVVRGLAGAAAALPWGRAAAVHRLQLASYGLGRLLGLFALRWTAWRRRRG